MTDPKIVRTDNEIAIVEDGQKVAWVTMPDPNADPMIIAANTLEASPKPSYGPYKASERYLDDEDRERCYPLDKLLGDPFALGQAKVDETLQALETLRTHLRKKYYGGMRRYGGCGEWNRPWWYPYHFCKPCQKWLRSLGMHW